MGGPRVRKPLIKSRRRVADEGEEEEGSVAAGVEEDSLSEGSVISDADDDADGEGSDGSEAASPVTKDREKLPVTNGHSRPEPGLSQPPRLSPTKAQLTATTGDTAVMMNGLKIGDDTEGVEVHFDDLAEQIVPNAQTTNSSLQGEGAQSLANPTDRGRKEHEEYKKRRDADPAFVPNRGGFFMHDHRSAAPGQNGFRPFGRGRGRGRGAGPFPTFGYVKTLYTNLF